MAAVVAAVVTHLIQEVLVDQVVVEQGQRVEQDVAVVQVELIKDLVVAAVEDIFLQQRLIMLVPVVQASLS